MIYYIFRHGETFYTKNNLHYGENYESAEILAEGIPVVEKLGEYLKGITVDAGYTSPFKRAIQTTDIVSKITGYKFKPDDRIREEGLSRAEETLEDLESRLKDFLSEMERSKHKAIAICSHGWPIAALLAIVTKDSVTKKDLGEFPRCGQLTIVENNSIKTLDFN